MHEHGCPGFTLVRNYPDTHQGIRSLSVLDIISALWVETTRVVAARLGFNPEEARMHSLCSGVSMAIHIAGSQITLSWSLFGGAC